MDGLGKLVEGINSVDAALDSNRANKFKENLNRLNLKINIQKYKFRKQSKNCTIKYK